MAGMKRILAAIITCTVLSIPAAAAAQDTTPDAQARFRASLAASTGRSIDSRQIEKRLGGGDRSMALMSLYGSLAALNVLDVVSSRKAIAAGGTERNPLMKDAIQSNHLSLGIKAASTLGTVMMIDRISKKSRKAAIVTAIVANGVTAAIVAHNLRQVR